MTRPMMADMQFRLSAPTLDFWVDVRLRERSGRWIAVAENAGDLEFGIAPDATGALAAALSSLGADAVGALLADVELLSPSCEIRRASISRSGEFKSAD